jgi:hypothetical protein
MSTTPQSEASSANASTAEDLGSDVTTALSSADSTASQRIQNLSLVHQARLSQLTRTAASLTAKYGASSAQATTAQAAVTASKATIARVAIIKQQAATPAPQVASTGWALHGRVFNADLQPVSGYTVFLVDAQNAYQSAYGFAYTDSTGYFQLNFAGTPATGKGQKAQQAALSTAQTSSELFVEIANSKSQPVYLGMTAFQPNLGTATYQNVTLAAGEKPIGDPPDAIRKVALPKAEKSS